MNFVYLSWMITRLSDQSTAQRFMPLRVLKYKIDIMNHHLSISGDKILPVVYALVLYNGKIRYNEPIALVDLFAKEQHDLAKASILEPFQLIDLTQVPEEVLRKQVWLHIVEGCLKHIYDRDILPFVNNLLHALQQAEAQGGHSLVHAALTYLMTAGEVSDPQGFIATIEHGLSTQTQENLMTIAQQFETKGRQEGIQQGIQQGMQQGMQQGEYSLLLRQLERKFKTLTPHYREKLAQADAETLLLWGERLVEAQRLEDIFAETNKH